MIPHLTERKLETIVGESVRKALKEELMKLRAFGVPYISESEQKEIEKLYGQPSKKSARKIKVNL